MKTWKLPIRTGYHFQKHTYRTCYFKVQDEPTSAESTYACRIKSCSYYNQPNNKIMADIYRQNCRVSCHFFRRSRAIKSRRWPLNNMDLRPFDRFAFFDGQVSSFIALQNAIITTFEAGMMGSNICFHGLIMCHLLSEWSRRYCGTCGTSNMFLVVGEN